MLIQIVLIIFVFLVILRLIARFRKKEINTKEFLIWLIFWIAAGLVAAWPKVSDIAAQYLGVGTGFNLLVALSILIIFYLIFRLFVKLEKTQKDISKIVEHIALEEFEDKKEDKFNI